MLISQKFVAFFMNYKDQLSNEKSRILILGALGQIGTVLTKHLRKIHGDTNVVASDIRLDNLSKLGTGPFEIIDATNYDSVVVASKKYSVKTIYLMAAVLSANAEKDPNNAWNLNMQSLFNVLDLAKDGIINKIFWPSSIAVFGPSTPKVNVPQTTIMEPTTIYGISKLAGERLCEYYINNYNIDVRSLRYPGIIGWESDPGGGTTDYAVDIFHKAISNEVYDCFLSPNTMLPMIYMEDAIRATIEIMNADLVNLSIKSSYNLSGLSFTPNEISKIISQFYPNFSIHYKPDFRQRIADSWPDSIDDSKAQIDFKWNSLYDLEMICEQMIKNLRAKKNPIV